MKLYYTTSAGFNERQPKPSISLGGFKSSSSVLNNNFNNLFNEISVYTITKENNEYIALMLVNETGNVCENVKIWFDIPETSYSLFKISGIIPAINGDGDNVIERIETRTSKPFYADFEIADEINKYSLGTIQSEQQIGIWIERSLKLDYIKNDSSNVYESDPENTRRFKKIEKEKQDVININISWD